MVVQSDSMLHAREKGSVGPQVGVVNGLAVYGANMGMLLK